MYLLSSKTMNDLFKKFKLKETRKIETSMSFIVL